MLLYCGITKVEGDELQKRKCDVCSSVMECVKYDDDGYRCIYTVYI